MNKESINEIIEELIKIDKKTIDLIDKKNDEINSIKEKYEYLLRDTKEKYHEKLEKEKKEIKQKIIKEGEDESSKIITTCKENENNLYYIYDETKESLLKKVFKKILS